MDIMSGAMDKEKTMWEKYEAELTAIIGVVAFVVLALDMVVWRP